MKSKIFYAVCIALLMGCEKKNDSFPNASQLVLFQAEYINYALGYDHNGILIDSSGNVSHFKFPKNWHYPDTANYLSESDMNENIGQLDKASFTIEKDILLKYFNKLNGASEGQLSKPVNRMFDAGELTYSGYLYDSNNKKYKHVLIRRDGDWSIENNSPEAEEIYRWLMKIYFSENN